MATYNGDLAGPAEYLSRRQRLAFLQTVLLVGVAVVVCHLFQWHWLCALTQGANMWLDSVFGLHMQPLGPTTLLFRGELYYYEISCTFVDVWFGLVPFLWNPARSVARNMLLMAGLALALFPFNIVRLSISDLLFAHGIDWTLAHSVFGGLCYFLIWRVALRIRTATGLAQLWSCEPPLAKQDVVRIGRAL